MSDRHSRIARLPAQQAGVALIVALVVLVIIGLTSAAVMRGALSSDLVTNNTRVQSLANQAAQVALKYCEQQVKTAGGPPAEFNIRPKPIDKDAKLDWETFGNWTNVDYVNKVPEQFMKSELSSFWPSTMPQCVAQWAFTPNTMVITARGFSPDFQANPDTGGTEAGSVVWLQYILAMKP
jgi:type IV pilus assembly protein PilX